MYHFFNIHSTTDEHLDCFIGTVKPFHWNTVWLEQCHKNTRGCRCLFDIEFSFPLHIYSKMELLVVIFLIFLGILQTVFHSNCTKLHSHKQCTSVFFSTHPHQCLVSVVFLRNIYLFIYLTVLSCSIRIFSLYCGMQTLSCNMCYLVA